MLQDVGSHPDGTGPMEARSRLFAAGYVVAAPVGAIIGCPAKLGQLSQPTCTLRSPVCNQCINALITIASSTSAIASVPVVAA
jgi:hypothetical protein